MQCLLTFALPYPHWQVIDSQLVAHERAFGTASRPVGTKLADTTAYLLVPLFIGANHWALVIADLEHSTFQYLDSLPLTQDTVRIKEVVNAFGKELNRDYPLRFPVPWLIVDIVSYIFPPSRT